MGSVVKVHEVRIRKVEAIFLSVKRSRDQSQ
jgi:hypothetical protein